MGNRPAGFLGPLSAGLLTALFVSGATAADISPSADTHISTQQSANNFGSANLIAISPKETALLSFNVAASLPTGVTPDKITKATLTIFVSRVARSGQVEFLPIRSGWAESAVTSQTRPVIDGPGSGVLLVVGKEQDFYVVDWTSQVKAWAASQWTGNFGVAITPSLTGPNTSISLDSKEGAGHPVRLDITLADQGARGPQGPVGPAGPVGAPGSPGAVGPSGPVGSSGPVGATGPQGSAGPPGLAGTPGVPGLRGQAGPAGPTGATGSPGARGPSGPPGASGPVGARGPAGATGSQGPAGLPGVRGATGATGAQGLQGAQGPQGPAGAGSSVPDCFGPGKFLQSRAGVYACVDASVVTRTSFSVPDVDSQFECAGAGWRSLVVTVAVDFLGARAVTLTASNLRADYAWANRSFSDSKTSAFPVSIDFANGRDHTQLQVTSAGVLQGRCKNTTNWAVLRSNLF